MYHCHFSTEDQRQIREQRYRYPDPLVCKRLTVLWHKHNGFSHQSIAKLSDVAPNTVTASIRTYLEKSLAGVQERKFHCPTSQLDPHRSRLVSHFSARPPRTLKEAAAEIEQLTGLSFTLAHVRNALLSIGLSRKNRTRFRTTGRRQARRAKNVYKRLLISKPRRREAGPQACVLR
jgi:transposase